MTASVLSHLKGLDGGDSSQAIGNVLRVTFIPGVIQSEAGANEC